MPYALSVAPIATSKKQNAIRVADKFKMKKRKARTNTEVTNFVIGCGDACRLEQEIHSIMDDEPISLDHLELRLREAIGAVKRVPYSGLGNKRLNSFEKYCNSVLQTIVGHPH